MELSRNNRICFIQKKNKVIARLYEDDNIIMKASAQCSPEDQFDFQTGVSIALKRLISKCSRNNFKTGNIARALADVQGYNWCGKSVTIPKDSLYTISYVHDNFNVFVAEPIQHQGFIIHDLCIKDFEAIDINNFFTGDAVCIKSEIPRLTAGKIYNFVYGNTKADDGKFLFDEPAKSLEQIYCESNGTVQFLKIVQ